MAAGSDGFVPLFLSGTTHADGVRAPAATATSRLPLLGPNGANLDTENGTARWGVGIARRTRTGRNDIAGSSAAGEGHSRKNPWTGLESRLPTQYTAAP